MAGAPKIVITGGPGAGKTAIIELARRHFGSDLEVLQEAASVVFRGGFPRVQTTEGRKAAQRAIFHVQRELETIAEQHTKASGMLCDRGTVDGAVYWPEAESEFWRELGTSRAAEYARYSTVIHLRTPTVENGYKNERLETVSEADHLDRRLLEVWKDHPRVIVIESTLNFWDKMITAMIVLGRELGLASAQVAIPSSPPSGETQASRLPPLGGHALKQFDWPERAP